MSRRGPGLIVRPDQQLPPGAEDGGGTDAPASAPQVAGETPDAHGDGLVQIAYCHDTLVSHSWHQSMMDLLVYDKTRGLNVLQSAPIRMACSGPFGIIEGRNSVVEAFLEGPHEWLFWVDTDMGFRADSLDRLVAAADPQERPVVAGLCFAAQRVGQDGFNGMQIRPVPTLFRIINIEGRPTYASMAKYPEDSLVQVAGTGSAFILIHRKVLEGIRRKYGPTWYDPVTVPGGRPISEDLSFCWRVAATMAPIFVHTGIKTTHHKELWVGEHMYTQPEVDPVFPS